MLRVQIVTLLIVLVAKIAVAQDVALPFLSDQAGRMDDAPAGDVTLVSRDIRQIGWHQPCQTDCIESVLCEDCSDLGRAGSRIRHRFGVPAWLPEIHGDATIRGVEAPVDVSTRDAFKAIGDLDGLVAGRLEADAGRWGFYADGLYVKLSADRELLSDRLNASAGLENAIAEALITYDLFEEQDATDPIDASAELLAGARYWLVGGDVQVTGPRGNTISTSGTRQWVDPIIGGRIATPLTDRMLMRLRADIGGFGAASDFTWNIEAVGEYRCSECCGLQLGYRVLDVDYARGDGFAYDVNYRGPIATFVFDF